MWLITSIPKPEDYSSRGVFRDKYINLEKRVPDLLADIPPRMNTSAFYYLYGLV